MFLLFHQYNTPNKILEDLKQHALDLMLAMQANTGNILQTTTTFLCYPLKGMVM